MSRWFRHYAGLCRDEKLVSVAIKSRQPIERVVWVWAAILESAAEIDDNGRYSLDTAEVAYFLRADEADILSVVNALTASGRLDADAVVKWSNRQFRSDRSAERVAAHRERKRQPDVQNHCDAPLQCEPVTDWAFFEPSSGGFDFRRTPEWADVRLRIFARDNYTCSYCGERAGKLQCDHIVAVARGGSHDDANLTTSCKPCNQSKRDKCVDVWLAGRTF